ncbi:hypothetical protein MK805_08970 [Shimazuella sp. AN120528]|uniref:hypothetical protein n=1 Tax=Shimazuella soli TaxID=1892854 RepID=UPI001F0FD6A3|nr:hypothetical protein [Shimazuella soli]MCH5585101.1 hypothetical protein [Shimazuella soli]
MQIEDSNVEYIETAEDVEVLGDNFEKIVTSKEVKIYGDNFDEIIAATIKYHGRVKLSRERLIRMARGSEIQDGKLVLRRERNTWTLTGSKGTNRIRILKKDNRLHMEYVKGSGRNSSGPVINVNVGGTVGIMAPHVSNSTVIVNGRRR